MKVIQYSKLWIAVSLFVGGMILTSCSRRTMVSADQMQRLDGYVNSENVYVAEMFSDAVSLDCGVQPALTKKETDILDGMVDKIDPEMRQIFDQKYTAWLNCWTPIDSVSTHETTMRRLLKCNGTEFEELIEFCRQQDDDIFLLLYQLAVRAECPYDRLLLYPINDLLENFPEYNQYWNEVDLALQKEKPNLESRTCNEPTIWYTRKILESKYGYTYSRELSAIFD